MSRAGAFFLGAGRDHDLQAGCPGGRWRLSFGSRSGVRLREANRTASSWHILDCRTGEVLRPLWSGPYHSVCRDRGRLPLKRASPLIWVSEVYAILYAFSQPIKQVRPPHCLAGCVHRCPPSVIHCAPSHYSFVAVRFAACVAGGDS